MRRKDADLGEPRSLCTGQAPGFRLGVVDDPTNRTIGKSLMFSINAMIAASPSFTHKPV